MRTYSFKSKFIFKIFLLLLSFTLIFGFESCSVLKTFQNISRLKFKLGTVNNLNLNGVNVSGKGSINDFNAGEILKISSSVAQGKLPLEFTLNVNAENPNAGDGGNERTDLTLQSFPWRLMIDDKETITGNISAPILVPGKGETVTFPLVMQLDLFKFFGDRSYKDLINLALNLSGKGSEPVKIKLVAQPTVSSPIGNLTYPNELTIVQKEYR